MRQDCIDAVEAALNKDRKPDEPFIHLTVAQSRGIETRIKGIQAIAARKDPAAWRALGFEQRMKQAGELAAKEFEAEKAIKLKRLREQILLKAFNDRYVTSQIAGGFDTGALAELKAMDRILVPHNDGKNNKPSIDSQANGDFDHAIGRLSDVFEAVNPGLWKVFPWQRPEIQSQMRRALAGVRHNVDPVIAKAAEKYQEIANEFREVFNAAGGVIGKLENYDQPHPWSARMVMTKYGPERHWWEMSDHAIDSARLLAAQLRRDGPGSLAIRHEMEAKAQASMVDEFYAGLDRSKYIHDDGTPWTEGDVRDFLAEAFDTMTTGMKRDDGPARPGGAIKANRHSAHRQIHLLPEATEPLLKKYTEKGVLEAMTDHIRQMARDIAVVQRLGPNPDAAWEQMIKDALQKIRSSDRWAMPEASTRAYFLRKMFDHIAGNDAPPPLKNVADALSSYRAIKSGAVLLRAVITSVTDHATVWNAALSGGLNPVKAELNMMLGWAPKSRRYLKRMGLLTETTIGFAQRYSDDNLTARAMASRVSSFMVRKSGLNFVTELRRSGYAVTMMDAIGSLTRRKTSMNDLHGNDRLILMGKGINQATWNIWRAAKLQKYGINGNLLTPEAIMAVEGPSFDAKRRAVATLLGAVKEDTDVAVVTPGSRERVQMAGGTQAGTLGGELLRTAALYKGFPFAYIQRHLERAQRYDSTFGRVAYAGSLMITMTLMGAIAKTVADMLDGKNPPDFNPASEHGMANWGAAAVKGGGAGILGDFFFNEVNPSTLQSAGSYIGGPLAADVDTTGRITSNLLAAAGNGNEPDNQGTTPLQKAGIRSVQLAKGLIPGSSMWYTKALTDRYIYNALLEEIDPNYLQAMKARQQPQQGTTYFADPDAQAGLDGSHWDRPDIGTAWAQ